MGLWEPGEPAKQGQRRPKPRGMGALQWARQYRNRFFEQILPKAMLNKPPEDEARDSGRRKRVSRKSKGDIREGLRPKWAEELAANVTKTVWAKVRGMLAAGRTILADVPREAKADLEALVGRLGTGLRGRLTLHPGENDRRRESGGYIDSLSSPALADDRARGAGATPRPKPPDVHPARKAFSAWPLFPP